MRQKLFIAALILGATLLFGPTTSNALTIYEYTGINFNQFEENNPPAGSYNSSMFVSGSFTLAAPLIADSLLTAITPLAYSFNDGRSTLTNLNSTIHLFNVGTDVNGNIDEWLILVAIDPGLSCCVGDISAQVWITSDGVPGLNGIMDTAAVFQTVTFFFGPILAGDTGSTNQRGSWVNSLITAVPEPSSLLLLVTGLLGLPIVLRKYRR